MKWLVGLDLEVTGHGALVFAGWLAQKLGAESGERFVAAHIIDGRVLKRAVREHQVPDVMIAAEGAAKVAVDGTGAAEFFEGTVVHVDDAIDRGLVEQASVHGCRGFIVGRQAFRNDASAVRLGRVARRLLRQLPGPTVVVSPDIDASSLGEGPVVVATSLQDDSVSACQFARKMADALGRDLAVVHVVEAMGTNMEHYLPNPAIMGIHEGMADAAKEALEGWLAEHGISSDEQAVLVGGRCEQLAHFVAGRNTPMLVVGSRRLSAVERIFQTSVGSEVAGLASCPTVVIPAAD